MHINPRRSSDLGSRIDPHCGTFEKLVKYRHNAATGFLGKARGIQSEEQRHRTLLNLFLKGKLRKEVRFVCAWETGGTFQPNEFAEYRMEVINETLAYFLAGQHLHKKTPSC